MWPEPITGAGETWGISEEKAWSFASWYLFHSMLTSGIWQGCGKSVAGLRQFMTREEEWQAEPLLVCLCLACQCGGEAVASLAQQCLSGISTT